MNAKNINNLEIADSSIETRNLVARWRDIVKPGIYRHSGGRWKKYHESTFFRNERRIMEQQVQQAIGNLVGENQQPEGGFQPQTRRQVQWTVDPFWGVDRPQQLAVLKTSEQPGTSSLNTHQEYIPMEDGGDRVGYRLKPIDTGRTSHKVGKPPTGLVECGVKTLKGPLLTNINAGESLSKSLDIALDVMRNLPIHE